MLVPFKIQGLCINIAALFLICHYQLHPDVHGHCHTRPFTPLLPLTFSIMIPCIGKTSFIISWDNGDKCIPQSKTAIAQKSPSSLECGQSVYCSLFSEGLSLVVNENNANPTCRVFASEPIRNVVVIRPNLIRHYLARPLFYERYREIFWVMDF